MKITLMWITFANRSSPRRKTTFRDRKCLECSLVSMFPFRAAPFLFTAVIASSTFSMFSCIESRCTSSKSTGIPPALHPVVDIGLLMVDIGRVLVDVERSENWLGSGQCIKRKR